MLMLKLKLQYFGHLMWRADSGKDPDAGKDWGQEETGTTEDKMVGWHRRLNGHEFEQALGDGEGQGNLACCSPWGCKESDTTERLNWMLLSILWASLIHGLMSYYFWKIFIYYLQIILLLCSLSLSFTAGIPITCMLHCLILFHSSWMLCSFPFNHSFCLCVTVS